MLIGEYTHTIDDKNRMSLPSKFRQEMGKKVVVAPGLDNCISIYTVSQWEKISEKLLDQGMFQTNSRSFNRFMFGQAVETDVDSIGRILIPEHLKGRANLKEKAVVIGVQDRVEIWSDSAWAEYKTVVEKQADTLAEKMGGAGFI
jgi:MraZ protein